MNTPNSFTPPHKAPKLAKLADACHNGACNTYALIRGLGEAVQELPFGETREHPAVKMVLGQITYLCKETLGPTFEALEAYQAWAAIPAPVAAPMTPEPAALAA